jgi:hypothetical protein
MPPFQRTTASGTLPTEQTKVSIAIWGPTIGPHSREPGVAGQEQPLPEAVRDQAEGVLGR